MSDLGNKEIMAENIKSYMVAHKMDRAQLADAVNVPYPTVSDWINAKTYPRIDKIERMATYFNISKSDLVERKPAAPVWSDEQARKNIELFSALSADQQTEALRYMKYLLQSGEYDA